MVVVYWYTVKEVLEILESDNFGFSEVFLEPPDDGQQSEEDNADKDCTGNVNKLSGKQLQWFSMAKITKGGQTSYIGLDEDDGSRGTKESAIDACCCLVIGAAESNVGHSWDIDGGKKMGKKWLEV